MNCLMTEKESLFSPWLDIQTWYKRMTIHRSCWLLITTLPQTLISCIQLTWNHSKDKMILLRVRSKIREFYNWHLSNFYTWCQSDCTRLKLDLFPDVVPIVCVCQVVVYARNCLIQCNIWIIPLKCRKCIFKNKKAVSLCNYLLSCGFGDWIRGTRFLCFLALQGESLELENVLSDFIMHRLFYWCALSIKSHQILNMAATVAITRTELC